jgi:hypothetical protein
MLIVFFVVSRPVLAETSSSSNPILKLNQYSIAYALDSHLYIEKDRFMVPVELVREFMGVNVNYSSDIITISSAGKEILFCVGSEKAIVNGLIVELDAVIIRNSLNEIPYIPIRLILDTFGFTATWDNQWKRLEILDDRLMTSERAILLGEVDMLGRSGNVGDDDSCGIEKVEVENRGPLNSDRYDIRFYYQNKTGQDIPAEKLDFQYWVLQGNGVQTSAGGAKTYNQHRPALAAGGSNIDKISAQRKLDDSKIVFDYIILWARTLK